MLRQVRMRITYANVMSTLAVMIALGGTSYAAIKLPRNSVGTSQLRSGAVTSAKVRDGTLLKKDFKPGQVVGDTGAPGANGDPGQTGAKGDPGQTGAKGDPGAPGRDGAPGAPGAPGQNGAAGTARAYAYVSGLACGGAVGACPPPSKAKSITAVRRHSAGVYCITAAAPVDPATDVAIAGVDVDQTQLPEGNASAMAGSGSPPCAATEFKVVTQRLLTAITTTNVNNVSFWVAVP